MISVEYIFLFDLDKEHFKEQLLLKWRTNEQLSPSHGCSMNKYTGPIHYGPVETYFLKC